MTRRNKVAATGPNRAANKKCAYRVFVSYARKNYGTAEQIFAILGDNGLKPVWDQSFSFGHGFHDQIKSYIQHAHVFMPLITPESSRRGWVHQEIGYALAMNIPVLPVCYQPPPRQTGKAAPEAAGKRGLTRPTAGEFLHELQAIRLAEPVAQQAKDFDYSVFESLVTRFADPGLARYCCTEQREERAMQLSRFAEEAFFAQQSSELCATGHVRQRGALSSFHIPDRVITDAVWRDRYEQCADEDVKLGKRVDRARVKQALWDQFLDDGGPTPFHRKVQRMERVALTKHARAAGYSIIINPYRKFGALTRMARITRLNSLIEFLQSADGVANKAVVAVDPDMADQRNTTLVGDWFAAESVTMVGPRQTNFTTHAPSILTRVELFETELAQLLDRWKWKPSESRLKAVGLLQKVVADLHADRDVKVPNVS